MRVEGPHRGPLLNVRGWLSYPENSAGLIKETLERFVDRASDFGVDRDYVVQVNKAWTIPELQIPEHQRYLMWTYLFVGADLHQASASLLLAQVEALAAIWEWDGPTRIYVNGRIDVEDDAGRWAKTWTVGWGEVREASRP